MYQGYEMDMPVEREEAMRRLAEHKAAARYAKLAELATEGQVIVEIAYGATESMGGE